MGTIETLLARMNGQRVYFDANFLIYFLERTEPELSAVTPFIQACDNGAIQGMTGDAAIAEVMVRPYRNADAVAIARIKKFFARKNFIASLQHNAICFDMASQIRAKTRLKLVDALHYATAISADCRFLLTNDRAFKAYGNIEIISLNMLLNEPV